MQSKIIGGDSHDVDTWVDDFIIDHISKEYTLEKFWTHFHTPINDFSLPSNQYLFIKECFINNLDPLLIMSLEFVNEDAEDWTWSAPAVAVRTNGTVLYSTYQCIHNFVIKEFLNVANIHYLQMWGYLITDKS